MPLSFVSSVIMALKTLPILVPYWPASVGRTTHLHEESDYRTVKGENQAMLVLSGYQLKTEALLGENRLIDWQATQFLIWTSLINSAMQDYQSYLTWISTLHKEMSLILEARISGFFIKKIARNGHAWQPWAGP